MGVLALALLITAMLLAILFTYAGQSLVAGLNVQSATEQQKQRCRINNQHEQLFDEERQGNDDDDNNNNNNNK